MIIVLTVIRLLAPLLIFKKSKLAIVSVLLLDGLDYQLFPRIGNWYEQYARWDKAIDLYSSFVFVSYIATHWQEKVAKKVGYGLLAFRLIGVLLFELTSIRFFLFLFPNLFENFLVYKEFIEHSTKKIFNAITEIPTLISLTVLGVFKLIQEYFIHVSQVLPWQTSAGEFVRGNAIVTTYINGTIWLGFFVLLHLIVLWLVSRYRAWKQLSPSDLSLYIWFQHFLNSIHDSFGESSTKKLHFRH